MSNLKKIVLSNSYAIVISYDYLIILSLRCQKTVKKNYNVPETIADVLRPCLS